METENMAEMVAKIKITDLPAFDLFRQAAPAWMKQVTQADYKATEAERNLFGAIMTIVEAEE